MDRPIDWRGSSLDDLRGFPEAAPKFEEGIYVLHSFPEEDSQDFAK
jgi:phage-related protein